MQDNAELTGAGNLTVTANSSDSITASPMNGRRAASWAWCRTRHRDRQRHDHGQRWLGSELTLTGGSHHRSERVVLGSSSPNSTTATGGGVGIGLGASSHVSSDYFDADLASVSAAFPIEVTADPSTASSQAAAIASESGAEQPRAVFGHWLADGRVGTPTPSRKIRPTSPRKRAATIPAPAPGQKSLPSSDTAAD